MLFSGDVENNDIFFENYKTKIENISLMALNFNKTNKNSCWFC